MKTKKRQISFLMWSQNLGTNGNGKNIEFSTFTDNMWDE